MLKFVLLPVALVMGMCALTANVAIAGVLVEVLPAFGPDLKGPSDSAFFLNAVNELRFPGSTSVVRADDPKGYQLVPSGPNPYSEVVSSIGFNSWRGRANPTAGWDDGMYTPGAFSGEFGTQIYFGARILVDDPLTDDIRLADLNGEIHWDDYGIGPSTVLTRTLSIDFSDHGYDFARVGVHFGADGSPGGFGLNADTVYNSPATPNTVPVDAIYLVGLADSIVVDTFGKPTDQEDLDEAYRLLDEVPIQLLTASYTIASVNDPGSPVTVAGEVLFTQSHFDPGDYDRDGDVDLDDYTEWTDQFGLVGNFPADGNDDGRVDAADFTVWRDHYAAVAASQSVPEPSGFVMVILGFLVIRRPDRLLG